MCGFAISSIESEKAKPSKYVYKTNSRILRANKFLYNHSLIKEMNSILWGVFIYLGQKTSWFKHFYAKEIEEEFSKEKSRASTTGEKPTTGQVL